MRALPRFVPFLVTVILGLAGLVFLTSAWGTALGETGPKHHGKYAKCERHHPGHRAGPGKHWRHGRYGGHGRAGPYGPGRLAMKLSAMETAIGIRANQLDAWRDFTDALLAVKKRPQFPKAGKGKQPPFALAQSVADNAIARAKAAENLIEAIDVLRTKLTPEQLENVAEIETRIRARHGRRCAGRGFKPPMPDRGVAPGADAPEESGAPPPASEE